MARCGSCARVRETRGLPKTGPSDSRGYSEYPSPSPTQPRVTSDVTVFWRWSPASAKGRVTRASQRSVGLRGHTRRGSLSSRRRRCAARRKRRPPPGGVRPHHETTIEEIGRPRIPYADPSSITDPEIRGYLERARLEGTPSRPRSPTLTTPGPIRLRQLVCQRGNTGKTGQPRSDYAAASSAERGHQSSVRGCDETAGHGDVCGAARYPASRVRAVVRVSAPNGPKDHLTQKRGERRHGPD
jgi:hypothetical protein